MSVNQKFNKANIRFETEVEKKFHKIVSALTWGEVITIDIDGSDQILRKEVNKAIKKSAAYNCMLVYTKWTADGKAIRISHEG